MQNSSSLTIVRQWEWRDNMTLTTTCNEGEVTFWSPAQSPCGSAGWINANDWSGHWLSPCDDCRCTCKDIFNWLDVPSGSWPFVLWLDGWWEECSLIDLKDVILTCIRVENATLIDELLDRIVPDGCITIVPAFSGGTKIIEIWFDKSCLTICLDDLCDWPVPVECDPCDYWAINYWDKNHTTPMCEPCKCEEECVRQVLTYCASYGYKWICDQECCDPRLFNPVMQLVLCDSLHFQADTGTGKTFYYTEAPVAGLPWSWTHLPWAQWKVNIEAHKINYTPQGIELINPGYYWVRHRNSQEQNIGIHWTRTWLWIKTSTWFWAGPQSRYSGTDSFFYGVHPDVDPNEHHFWDNIWTSSMGGQSLLGTDPLDTARNWGTYSMGRVMERFPNWDWALIFSDGNTLVIPFVKMDTTMTGDTEAQMVDYAGKTINWIEIKPTVSILGTTDESADWGDWARITVFKIWNECDAKYRLKKYAIGPYAP